MRPEFALACGLLLAALVACRTHGAPPRKVAPAALVPATPSPIASTAVQASANTCASAWPAPIELSALKTAPKSAALSPLRAQPGLWLADESSALLSATPDPAWAEGPLTLTGAGSSATRSVALTRLPQGLRGWLGRPVKVLGASGAVCETRLQRFALRAQVTPDPRTAEHWEGCADGPAMPPETIAQEIWRLSAVGGRTLIAEFSAPCKGALLAVDPNLPVPAIAAPEPAAPEVGAAVLAAFRALPEYAALQTRFRAEHPDVEGAWDDRDARRSVSKLALPGRPELLFVSVETGSGCTGFSASLSALWEAGPSGPSKVLAAIDNRRLSPSAIVDFDGNGSSLLLGPDGPLQMRSVLRPGSYQRSFLSDVPYFAGPC
ncbi:MAG: hypothetical protein WDO74_33505 [Pseudomonadota bacterium]